MGEAFQWTNAKNDRLKELWESGKHTASGTAMILADEWGVRVTKNMVIGKVGRLKLKKQPRGKKPSGKPRAPKTKKQPNQLVRWRPILPESLPGDMELLKADVWKALVGSSPKPLIAVSIEDTCRWPIGEKSPYLFCGNEIHKGGFCKVHHRAAYREPEKKPSRMAKAVFSDSRVLEEMA